MNNNIFKQDAKNTTDVLFDMKIFRDDLKRSDIQGIEDLISFLLKSRYEGYLKAQKLTQEIEASRIKNKIK